MILGATTSWKLRVTPSAAGSLKFAGSLVLGTAATPMQIDGATTGPATLQSITTSGSAVDLVTGSATQKTRIDEFTLSNESTTVAPSVEFDVTDGTTPIAKYDCVLLPGEKVHYFNGAWRHLDANGAEYAYAGPVAANLGATGTIAETMARELCPEVNTTAGASGTLFMQAIYLKAGQIVSSITAWSATTAAGTTTALLFGLFDGARNLVATSTNQGAYTWAANSKKTLSMTSSYRVPSSGVYYIGILQVATTIATLKGGTAKTGGQLAADAPILNGTSSTGLTTSLPNPAAAITGGTASIYAAVS